MTLNSGWITSSTSSLPRIGAAATTIVNGTGLAGGGAARRARRGRSRAAAVGARVLAHGALVEQHDAQASPRPGRA